jgi:hypothetical protein
MKLKVTLETYINCDIYPDEYTNSDTREEYKEQLQCDIGNDALEAIWRSRMCDISEECKIISVEPYEEGIDEYNNLINGWHNEYVS